MQIGITERGDAGINLAWAKRLNNVDGAVLITKHITDAFCAAVIGAEASGTPIVVHCTCTGWGGETIEPHVPTYMEQLDMLAKLITEYDFPKEKCVIRIDPIFPTDAGLERVNAVLAYARRLNLLPMRVRISIYDEYPHVRQRLANIGMQPLYGGSFYAPLYMMQFAARKLSEFSDTYGVAFETCAEPKLIQWASHDNVFVQEGCLSLRDIILMGLDPAKAPDRINGQNRSGCCCLACKKELLTERHPCPHKCLYCFWKD